MSGTADIPPAEQSTPVAEFRYKYQY
jgi:hypothetical protein